MKRTLLPLAIVCAVLGFAAGVLLMSGSHRDSVRPAPSSAAALETQSTPETPAPARIAAPIQSAQAEIAQTAPVRTFEQILRELASIRILSGPAQGRSQYRILALLEELARGGSSALPSIRAFLASGQDVPYSVGSSRGRNQGVELLPPTLRFALLDVVRQIGGPESEQLLVESLNTSASGPEFAYVCQLLESVAPDKYRDNILTAARGLLASGKLTDDASRSAVYSMLRQYKDTSYIATAQAALVSPEGKVDRAALSYLRDIMGASSLALATQTYGDPRVADAESKEALGRLALAFVGANDQALDLYHKAALDPQLTPDQRRNLIEDLNEDGLSNKRQPTADDLKIIASRYAITQTYLQQDYIQNDKVLRESFQEADKDLRKMLERAGALQ